MDSLKSVSKGYPVAPFGDTIYVVYVKIGSFSAETRANSNAEKIEKLADDYFFESDSLKLNPTENQIELVYNDNIILSLTDKDALWMGTTKSELAKNTGTKYFYPFPTIEIPQVSRHWQLRLCLPFLFWSLFFWL
ncbi:MAG: hypothetical protein IPJ75_00460 [Ignavibacteriales bacterium]|nr:hypothetical protein [Ignavibacteriales bacterium]